MAALHAGTPLGNLLSDGARTYTYTTANRVSSIAQGASSYSFVYNGLGDRLQQTVDAATTSYTPHLNNDLTQVLTDGTDTYLYGNGRIGEKDGAAWSYYLTDAKFLSFPNYNHIETFIYGNVVAPPLVEYLKS